MADMAAFDYDAEAELFPGAARPARRQPRSLAGAALEVGDERFDCHGMRQLYEAADYPLARRERSGQGSSAMQPTSRGSGPVPGSQPPRKGRERQDRD
jgi:hypothetical protein